MNNGQICIAPDYVMVHQSIKEKFKNAIINIIKEFYKDDISQSTSYCRIVNDKHFKRIKSLLVNSVKNGDKITYGGKVIQNQRFIEPTLIEKINKKSRINDEEIFGPLLPLYEFEEIDEVIKFVNKKEKPLALYIFSNNKKW